MAFWGVNGTGETVTGTGWDGFYGDLERFLRSICVPNRSNPVPEVVSTDCLLNITPFVSGVNQI